MLAKVAPKRFNPTHEAWLPVLHARRGPWHLTALYSNTARAHELDRVEDWEVLYFHLSGKPEMQRTVVTEKRGALRGKRVVCGREAECRQRYGVAPSPGGGAASRRPSASMMPAKACAASRRRQSSRSR